MNKQTSSFVKREEVFCLSKTQLMILRFHLFKRWNLFRYAYMCVQAAGMFLFMKADLKNNPSGFIVYNYLLFFIKFLLSLYQPAPAGNCSFIFVLPLIKPRMFFVRGFCFRRDVSGKTDQEQIPISPPMPIT